MALRAERTPASISNWIESESVRQSSRRDRLPGTTAVLPIAGYAEDGPRPRRRLKLARIGLTASPVKRCNRLRPAEAGVATPRSAFILLSLSFVVCSLCVIDLVKIDGSR